MAHGYLIDQFLQDKTNQRDDDYGGGPENRARFLFEVLDVVTGIWGADRVGLRLSPTGTFNDMGDSDPLTTFGYVIEKLNERGLAYIHMVENFPGIDSDDQARDVMKALRARWTGFYIANGAYDRGGAMAAIETGHADAIAFGRAYLANPDLPERLAQDAPLNTPDESTFYGGGAEGYTDYPFMDKVQAA